MADNKLILELKIHIAIVIYKLNNFYEFLNLLFVKIMITKYLFAKRIKHQQRSDIIRTNEFIKHFQKKLTRSQGAQLQKVSEYPKPKFE